MLQAVHDQIGDGTRRHRHDDQVDVGGHRRIDRASAQARCDPGVADLVITKMYGVAGRRKGASNRGPDLGQHR